MKFLSIILMHLMVMNIKVMMSETQTQPTLKLIQMVHRHGDRTPIHTYPTDPYGNASFWPDGWGQLTDRGKDRMYRVGKFIRQRYQDYFKDLSPREVHIRSSAADRCLETVSLILAGAFPPEGRWQWDNTLGKLWQPFPIQTLPRPLDGMLNPGSICPAADEELQKIRQSTAVRDYTEKRKGLLQYVSLNTGLNITELIPAEELFDTLFVEKDNGLTLPHWVTEDTFESLSELSAMTFYFDFSTRLIQRFRAGLVLQDLVKHMKDAVTPQKQFLDIVPHAKEFNTPTPPHKLYIYSTHDTQLAAILNALNVFNMKAPPYGSLILFELYENNTDHIVKIYYMNNTDTQEYHLLNLPGCNDHNNECHLGQFLHSIEDLIPTNWKRECRFKDESSEPSGSVIVSYLIGSLLSFVMMTIVFLTCFYFKRNRDFVVYHMLPVG